MKGYSTPTRRQLLFATTAAGMSALAGCSGDSESNQKVGRGRQMGQILLGGSFGTKEGDLDFVKCPAYSEAVYTLNRNDDNEGYADPGILTMEVGEVVTNPRRRIDSGQDWKEGNTIERFNIDLEEESESTFAYKHKISPGLRYGRVEYDITDDQGKRVNIDLYATVYRYHRDPSNLECSQEAEQIELDYIYIQDDTFSSEYKLHYDISYSAARLESYDLDITVQAASDETTITLSQWSGDCQTRFIGERKFYVETSFNKRFLLLFEIKDSGKTLSSKQIQIVDN